MMSNNLKSLQMRKKRLENEITGLENDKVEICGRIKEKRNQLAKIKNNIKELRSKVIITEHAKIRYLERVKGIDMAEVEKEILDEDLKKQILVLGTGKFHRNGLRLVVRNNSIVTVEKEE